MYFEPELNILFVRHRGMRCWGLHIQNRVFVKVWLWPAIMLVIPGTHSFDVGRTRGLGVFACCWSSGLIITNAYLLHTSFN